MARNINEIKFNAVDYENNEYIKYDDWLEENGLKHNLESMSAFFSEYFGFELLQYVGFKDKNNIEIYEDDTVRIIINGKISIAKVINFENAFIFKFIQGDLIEEDFLPVKYMFNCVTENIELIVKDEDVENEQNAE